MKYIAKIISQIPPSGIRKFFDLVMGMKDVISLGVGEPDFVTPWNICETAIHSIEQGYTCYTSNKGIPELRQAICHHLHYQHKIHYNPDTEILITAGVSEAMDLSIRAIINPGDQVIIPAPSYVSYGPMVTLAGGQPVYIYTSKDNGFKINAIDITNACSRKTKAIILNYPVNPTGVSYTKSELEKLKKAIHKNNLLVISDEIYDELSYDFKHTPWPSLTGAANQCIYLNGFSKAYAMTGWRLGYAAGPRKIIAAMTKIHQYTMLCASTPGQVAAIEAIQSGQQSVNQMREEYRRRRNFVVSGLQKIGLNCLMPKGAFYVFCPIDITGLDSVEFANRLLKEQKVAVVPGTAFGSGYNDYIRISYASSMENLKEALFRIAKFIQHTKK